MAVRLLRGFARFVGWLAIPPVLLAVLALLMAADTALRQASANSYDWMILLYICSLALCLPQLLLLRLFGVKSATAYMLAGALSMWLAMFAFACFLDYGSSNGYFVNTDTNPVAIFRDYISDNFPLIERSARFLLRAPLHGFVIFIVPALFGLFLGRQYWNMRIAHNSADVTK